MTPIEDLLSASLRQEREQGFREGVLAALDVLRSVLQTSYVVRTDIDYTRGPTVILSVETLERARQGFPVSRMCAPLPERLRREGDACDVVVAEVSVRLLGAEGG